MDPDEISKWRKIRWGATAVFILFLTALAFLPMIIGVDETAFFFAYTFIFIVTFIPFIMILNRPYSKRKSEMDIEPKKDPVVSRSIIYNEPGSKVFNDHVDMWFLLVIIIPVALITVIPLMITWDIVLISIALGTIVFFAVIIGLFFRLRIEADQEHISFHWGPIGRSIGIQEIRSIGSIDIHPLKDYMGWGIRSGTDGSLGYISQSRKGVKIETTSNKVYVVSCNKPQELTDLVKWAIHQR